MQIWLWQIMLLVIWAIGVQQKWYAGNRVIVDLYHHSEYAVNCYCWLWVCTSICLKMQILDELSWSYWKIGDFFFSYDIPCKSLYFEFVSYCTRTKVVCVVAYSYSCCNSVVPKWPLVSQNGSVNGFSMPKLGDFCLAAVELLSPLCVTRALGLRCD